MPDLSLTLAKAVAISNYSSSSRNSRKIANNNSNKSGGLLSLTLVSGWWATEHYFEIRAVVLGPMDFGVPLLIWGFP